MEKTFKINEGTLTRILRVAAGIGLLSLTVVGPRTSCGGSWASCLSSPASRGRVRSILSSD